MFGFLVTFVVSRIFVFLIMSDELPNFYFFLHGTHVHHLNYGIFLLAAVCGYSVFRRPVGRKAEITALLYGVAMGLTFDEFGMWLHLGGSYWQRASVDAVIVVAALFGLVAFGRTVKRFEARHFWAFVVLLVLVIGFSFVLHLRAIALAIKWGLRWKRWKRRLRRKIKRIEISENSRHRLEMGVFSEQNSGKNLENHAMNSGHGQNNSLATNVSRHSSETNLTTMQKLTSLIVSGSFCLGLLAGCATRNSSPISAASNPVPIIVSHEKLTMASSAVENSASTNRIRNDMPFGKYDSAIIEAIERRWYDILGKLKFKQDRHGKVVVRYHLHSDGTVSDIKTLKNNVGEVLGYICIEAIKDCAPFAPWPPDMVRMVGQDYREITFTFYYQ